MNIIANKNNKVGLCEVPVRQESVPIQQDQLSGDSSSSGTSESELKTVVKVFLKEKSEHVEIPMQKTSSKSRFKF
jgi:hypothetical protein